MGGGSPATPALRRSGEEVAATGVDRPHAGFLDFMSPLLKFSGKVCGKRRCNPKTAPLAPRSAAWARVGEGPQVPFAGTGPNTHGRRGSYGLSPIGPTEVASLEELHIEPLVANTRVVITTEDDEQQPPELLEELEAVGAALPLPLGSVFGSHTLFVTTAHTQAAQEAAAAFGAATAYGAVIIGQKKHKDCAGWMKKRMMKC